MKAIESCVNQKLGVGFRGVETVLDGKKSQQRNFHPTFEAQGVFDKVCVPLEKTLDFLPALSACLPLLFVFSNNQMSRKFQKSK